MRTLSLPFTQESVPRARARLQSELASFTRFCRAISQLPDQLSGWRPTW